MGCNLAATEMSVGAMGVPSYRAIGPAGASQWGGSESRVCNEAVSTQIKKQSVGDTAEARSFYKCVWGFLQVPNACR